MFLSKMKPVCYLGGSLIIAVGSYLWWAKPWSKHSSNKNNGELKVISRFCKPGCTCDVSSCRCGQDEPCEGVSASANFCGCQGCACRFGCPCDGLVCECSMCCLAGITATMGCCDQEGKGCCNQEGKGCCNQEGKGCCNQE